MASATPASSPVPAPTMTPQDALEALADLPRYEERLTARAFGMTSMVWGLATAGIFLTYAAAQMPFGRHGVEYLFSVLWLPWVAAGCALTATVWHAQALTLRRPAGTRRGLLLMAAYVAGFFLVAAGALVVIEVVLDRHFNFYLEMLLVNGLFAAGVGLAERGRNPGAPLTLALGLLAAAAAVALVPLRIQSDAAALIGAAGAGLAFFVPGLYAYTKG